MYGNCDDAGRKLLQKLIEAVLKSNPKYLEDLNVAFDGFATFLDDIKQQFGCYSSKRNGEMSWTSLLETIYKVVDVSGAMSSFISSSPLIAKRAHENGNLAPAIANFYDAVMPAIQQELTLHFNRTDAQL